MSTPSPSPQTRRLAMILGMTAMSDLVIGVVLLAVGLTRDSTTMLIIGGVLAFVGLGFSAWSFRVRNTPISL